MFPIARTHTLLALALVAACSPEAGAPSRVLARASSAQQTPAEQAGWRSQVLYLVVTDRFRNGDTSNDDAGAPNCHDPGDPQRFHGGDFAGLRAGLDYVRDLGASAVWVTPAYRQIGRLGNGHCGYHGYWADYVAPYDDAIEPKLGAAADLVGLAGDLHARSMRLVLDMVVNHTGDTARLPGQNPGWFHDPHGCQSLGDPEVYCPLDGHPDFAQEQPKVAAYLSDVAARWTRAYGLDGIRMDTAKHVPAAYFHDSFFPAVRGVEPALFSVAEIFDEGSAQSFVPYLDAGFDAAFHYPLYRALVDGIAHGGSIDTVASAVSGAVARVGNQRALDLVLFVDNHDVPRFVNEPGWGVPESEIRARYLLALDLIFTLPGIPQLYYGDEIGMYGAGDPDNRRDLPAWATDASARAQPHPGQAVAGSAAIFDRVRKLAALRTTTPALADGGYRELWRQNGAQHPNVFAFARGSGADARLVVASNGTQHTGMLRIPVPADVVAANTTLDDELGDGAPSAVTLDGGILTVDLPPHAAAVYRPR